jgi:uncharacterized protein (UPF0332 family)
MKFSIDLLIKEKLLSKIPPSKQKSQESIKSAELWLKESKNNFNSKSFNSCVLTSYISMFHAARSILFFDGYREKSHFAVARYLEEIYQTKGLIEPEWIKLLDYYRELRHEDQYSTSFFITEKDAKNALDSAKKFIDRIIKLLKDKE